MGENDPTTCLCCLTATACDCVFVYNPAGGRVICTEHDRRVDAPMLVPTQTSVIRDLKD